MEPGMNAAWIGCWPDTPTCSFPAPWRTKGRFYDRFEHVVLLSAPLDSLIERVSGRTNNPYGKTPEQRAEIAGYLQTVEPLIRRGATLQLDGRRPISELADAIERLVTGPSTSTANEALQPVVLGAG
jgi:hypothetical protein